MPLPADVKVIGQGLKERLGDVEHEPLLPEMENLLRGLDGALVRDLGKTLGDHAHEVVPSLDVVE